MDDYVELGCAADPLTGATDGRVRHSQPGTERGGRGERQKIQLD